MNQRVQVSFAVDETYSMGPVINGVRDNIKWFYDQLGGGAQGTVVGSGCDDKACSDSDYPGDHSGSSEPRDVVDGNGLTSNLNDLKEGADRLAERTTSEGPDDTISEAVGYGTEASDYTGGVEYYDDEYYGYDQSNEKAVIWVEDGGARGSCTGVSDFSEGALGDYLVDKGFKFYAIVRDLGSCRSHFETAAAQTGGEVYNLSSSPSNSDWQDILGDISSSIEVEANLTAAVDSNSYSTENYDSKQQVSGNDNYKFVNVNSVRGEHTFVFHWRPTDHGTQELQTGDSFLRIRDPEGLKTFGFSGSRQENVRYVDFDVENASILRERSKVYVNFTVENVGNTESKIRKVWIADGSGLSANYESYNLNRLSQGEEQRFTIELSESNPIFSDLESIYIRADPKGYWDGTSYGHGNTLEPNEANNVVNLGYPPRLEDISPQPTGGVSWSETFRPQFTYAHPNPGTVSGVYNFTNASVRMETNAAMDLTTNTDEAVLTTARDFFADPAERWYNFTVRVKDGRGATTIRTASYFVDNPKPKAFAIEPSDSGVVSSFPVNLLARVEDDNSAYHNRPLQVTIYDHNGDYLASASVSSGNTISHEWEIPNALSSQYEWTVEVEDKWDTVNTTFTFTKVVGRSYRSDLSIDLNYSSIVMNADSNRYAQLTVENNVNNVKDLTLNLTGVEAEFLGGGQSRRISAFPGQTQRTYKIRIMPDSKTDKDLEIVAENNNLGINTTRTIPVTVLENKRSSRDVPGLQLIHLLFVAITATVLYSVRL
ncbi:MAG: hypothetical protein ABEK16_01145 [Candidatus Nanohalobium sp.]